MTDRPCRQSLQSRLNARLERDPDGAAVGFYGRSGEFSWLSYATFYSRAASIGAGMRHMGISYGDVVMIVLPSSEFSATTLFAALLAGAVPLLMAPPTLQQVQKTSSLDEILRGVATKADPRLIIVPDSMGRLPSAPERTNVVTEQEMPSEDGASLPPVVPSGTDVACMQLTSGTTGFPRVCVWSQERVLAALDGMYAAMELTRDDVFFNWTPLYHDMGLVNNFLVCLIQGIPLAILDPQEFVKRPHLWLSGLYETGATTTWSPNFGFALASQRVTDRQLDGLSLSGVRGFWNAAERIHHKTYEEFLARFQHVGVCRQALKTNFGCAENIGGATFSDPRATYVVERLDRRAYQEERIARTVPLSSPDEHVIEIVSTGRPYPGMTVHILSEDGRQLPDGQIGEVALESPSRMIGYLKDPEATERALIGESVRTGDLGYVRDGELFWVGRVRDRIVVRGKKLDPSDFEPVLLGIDSLRPGNFVAFGVDDATQGTQRIVIAAEIAKSATAAHEEIVAEVRGRVFADLGVNVHEILLVPAGTLAKTSSGKRRHRHFRELYLSGALKAMEWRPGTPSPAE